MNLREQIDYLKHLKRLADFRFGAVSRFLQFCTVGFSGMIIDLTAYAILLAWGTSIYIARGIAISIAMTWNFFLNRKLTFSDRRDGQLIFQYLGFVASSAIGAIVSWTIATIFAPMLLFFREHLILAAVAGILTGTASNFTMCTRLVFRQKNRAARDVQQERWAVKDIISRLTLRKS
jgi:dolichol-phosphate mannosyltransferase